MMFSISEQEQASRERRSTVELKIYQTVGSLVAEMPGLTRTEVAVALMAVVERQLLRQLSVEYGEGEVDATRG